MRVPLESEQIRILSDYDDINTYINRLNLFKSVDEQVQTIRGNRDFVAYPTIEHLRTMHIIEEKPFSKIGLFPMRYHGGNRFLHIKKTCPFGQVCLYCLY